MDAAKPLRGLNINWRSLGPALFCTALVVAVFLPYYSLAPMRVGDGSEYYAMLLAIKQEHRPWLTVHSLQLYDALVSTQSISGMVPAQFLYELFPALRVGATFDFNHFWIYSLLAAGVSGGAEIFGWTLGPHQAFLTLHLLFTLGLVWLARALFGWQGTVAAAAMTLLSPMIWYIDKVHTEYFTYCTVLAAVMLVQRRHLAWSAAFLALASTQNPSFAIVSLGLLVWRLAAIRRSPLYFWELSAFVAAILLALLHPTYYYFRYGVLTPQLLAGGAKLGTNIQNSYVWLLDPDLGLLPNWPLGLALILLVVVAGIRHRRLQADWSMALFIAGFALVNLFAQSSTINMNSGASPGLARYSLWYIPFFFPLALKAIEWLASLTFAKKTVTVGAALVYAFANAKAYDPRLPEDYLHPSTVSRFLQTQLPGLYDPPIEVFVERYSGIDENVHIGKASAVLGPSCDKLLVITDRDPASIGNTGRCLVDYEKIRALTEKISRSQTGARYIRLGPNGLDMDIAAIPDGRAYVTALGKSGTALLGRGWYESEPWGTWAAGRTAEINVPCPRDAGEFKVALTLSAFDRTREASIYSENKAIWSGNVISGPTKVVTTLKSDRCLDDAVRLTLVSDSVDSPKTLGHSNDARTLGLGLIKIQYER